MTLKEIKKMESVCRLTADTLKMIEKHVKPGISTGELNTIVHDYILTVGCTPSPLNYHGFPKSICTSINDIVCHGVPQDKEILFPGDIINVDVTLYKDGFHGDSSRVFYVGEVNENAKRITEAARDGMYAGIEQVKAGQFTGNIGHATNKLVKSRGYYTVKDIGGHGIGRKFHMSPFVPANGRPGTGEKLIENTCITVEPMVNENSEKHVAMQIPNSSILIFKTHDGSLSAQFEHTILVTKTGHHILTEW